MFFHRTQQKLKKKGKRNKRNRKVKQSVVWSTEETSSLWSYKADFKKNNRSPEENRKYWVKKTVGRERRKWCLFCFAREIIDRSTKPKKRFCVFFAGFGVSSSYTHVRGERNLTSWSLNFIRCYELMFFLPYIMWIDIIKYMKTI